MAAQAGEVATIMMATHTALVYQGRAIVEEIGMTLLLQRAAVEVAVQAQSAALELLDKAVLAVQVFPHLFLGLQ